MCFCNCNTLQEPTGAVSPISSAKTALNNNKEESSVSHINDAWLSAAIGTSSQRY